MTDRFFGSHMDEQGRFTRIADRVVLHGEYLTAGDLFQKVITEKTKYLVMDMDKTIHLGRGLGELLGWEVPAYLFYGEAYMNSNETKRGTSRFTYDLHRPLTSLKYLLSGARQWTYPGLLYLFGCRLAFKKEWSRRLMYRLFGTHPVEVVQEAPTTALMHHISRIPLSRLNRWSEKLWQRLAGDQIFCRADFDALRARCPHLKIILSSASPQPLLEAARKDLGITDILYTTIEEHDGYLSAPHTVYRSFLLPYTPNRIAPRATFKRNAAWHKITNLVEHYPDIFDQGVESVGISDNSYGEDNAWAQYFTTVVDVNSPAPFSPIVSAISPLREIHSAQVLTTDERTRRDNSVPDFLDPRRKTFTPHAADLDKQQLSARLQPLHNAVEALAKLYYEIANQLKSQRENDQSAVNDSFSAIDEHVHQYNLTGGSRRDIIFKRLRGALKQLDTRRAVLQKTERPLADLTYSIEHHLIRARTLLDKENEYGAGV
ncbi:hypothetical protein KKF84_12435 [Myxococcota bacterium]|nr:hypothetical protein [Myxococcota bacterium]MBU1536123.1 hypothetical protein [Myxococcota bacterium]